MTENFKPKVTIMIPTFNQANFIGDAIDSALAQTYSNLEIIIGDDASTDSTQNIVKKKFDPRLKYVRNENNIGRTLNYRNLLYKHAIGDYVVNLDGDDYYTDPDFICKAVKLIESNDNVIMVVARVEAKSQNSQRISAIPSDNIFSGMQILRKLPDPKYLLMHMAVLYARKPALETGFYRSSAISSDWESLYRLSLQGIVKYLNRNVGVWRIHEMNETRKNDPAILLKNLEIWPVIYSEAIAKGMNSFLGKFICAKCIAFFAQSSCVKISMSGNKVLIRFMAGFLKIYGFPVLLFLLNPVYILRITLCFLGYYRRKGNV